MPEIRTFTRPDRDQLTELVNTHIAAVIPGWALPVSALLAQFEREPAHTLSTPGSSTAALWSRSNVTGWSAAPI